ncbi:TPA: helix-turn-helix domain-containing protein [Citrobacter braakii]|uniref:helix-turn-helix domain-containing protein n=2 Tax=Enterobacteriaceae TaxID=543 RepID=UPI0019086D2E|nr:MULTISPECIES: helix-turn-helix domain-containing protein [Citrobacter]MBJ9599462.1 helix-turn-helix domain-containing protein [Citrobacter werkmanii]MBJ9872658.1 helix-turn-helix domain-containing protein [Citrobacter werkmanii]MDM2942656.1 helix-turn-helix domain-containing protein [Citrobacter sp. Cm038]HEB0852707.1 helix-turn-helix domain-containing protein [Citrobacter freundii]
MLEIPRESIKRLGDMIIQYGYSFHLAEGNELIRTSPDDEPLFFYLVKGQVRYELSDDYWLSSVRAPMVLGFVDYYYPNEYAGRFFTETETSGFYLSAEKVGQLISENDLWYDVSVILSYIIRRLLAREMLLSSSNAYKIICHYLNILNSECPEVKERLSALYYLHKHTKLSKSMISLIISELKKGEYIDISKGHLKSIKFLPESF